MELMIIVFILILFSLTVLPAVSNQDSSAGPPPWLTTPGFTNSVECWEAYVAQLEASEDLYKWLKNMGVELELVSKQSTLYEGIPRVNL